MKVLNFQSNFILFYLETFQLNLVFLQINSCKEGCLLNDNLFWMKNLLKVHETERNEMNMLNLIYHSHFNKYKSEIEKIKGDEGTKSKLK